MNSTFTRSTAFLRLLFCALCCAVLCALGTARAGVTFQLQLYRYAAQYYLMFPSLKTNNLSANPPQTGYFVWSQGSSLSSGSHGQVYADGTEDSGSGTYSDYASLIQEVTNAWTLVVTNATATNTYHFRVSGFASNAMPAVSVTFPLTGSGGVTNRPTYTWQGPSNYEELFVQENDPDYSFAKSAYLPITQTNWSSPVALAYGSNYFISVIYNSNANSTVVASVPTNSLSQPLAGWSSACWMQIYADSYFKVAFNTSLEASGGHRLVARYGFNESDNLGLDSSANGNDMNGGGVWGTEHAFSTDTMEGAGAVLFFGSSQLTPSEATSVAWDQALGGSFSVSAWVNTSDARGSDEEEAISGATLLWAYNEVGNTNDTIPLAITGDKAAFSSRDHLGNSTTLHSTTSVNDGSYHLLTVTRNGATGEKRLYVDGVLEASEIGTTEPLNSNQHGLTIGGTPYSSYTGLLDDVQFYAGVLSLSEVAGLYSTPGSSAADRAGGASTVSLVARYNFEDAANPALDSSGNGNDADCSNNGTQPDVASSQAAVGTYGRRYFGDSSLCFTPAGSEFASLSNALATSFSLSAWINTTNSTNSDLSDAFYGLPILFLWSDSGSSTVPLSLTGSKAAFSMWQDGAPALTLHSTSTVNDGAYHLVVVTRSQANGAMNLYVDGRLEASGTGSSAPLTIPWIHLAGGYYAQYAGLLDDVQFYSGALNGSQVAFLYSHPGSTVTNLASELVAHYDFDEASVLAPDVSQSGNPIVYAGNFGGAGPAIDPDSVGGTGSVSFDGASYLTASSNLLDTIASNFSLSLWLKSSQSQGSPNDMAYWGAVIVSADITSGGAGDAVPLALTAGQVAFNTGSGSGDQTLNSHATVNDGAWHHVVVTRNQATGEKQIFIDGALDNSQIGTTVLLNGSHILTIGAKTDGAYGALDSPDSFGSQGFEGLLDDIQIYPRALSGLEVAYLYAHPGQELGSEAAAPYPVQAELSFSVVRKQEINGSESYLTFPNFISVSPAATTTNVISSPNGRFVASSEPTSGSTSSWIVGSLPELLNEWTNGLWKLYINKGSPTQQLYTFSASLGGLSSNMLPVVKILWPTNGAVNVATNPLFGWRGPSNYSSVRVDAGSGRNASLAVALTNWTAGSALAYGTNVFEVVYSSNNFPNSTFSAPLGSGLSPLQSWAAHVNLESGAFSQFVVGAPAPAAVALSSFGSATGTVQFAFTTLAGRPHTIQARTNLAAGSWLDLSNFVGDGALQSFRFATTNPPLRFFRVRTQ